LQEFYGTLQLLTAVDVPVNNAQRSGWPSTHLNGAKLPVTISCIATQLNWQARESRDSARCKRKAGIKSNHPNHIRTYCRPNQEQFNDVEKKQKQKDVSKEATPDDELSMPAPGTRKVRTAIVSFVVPYFQILF